MATTSCEFASRHCEPCEGDQPALAWIANREMHHPDLQVGYNHCLVTLTTHAIGGLSDNDFSVATRIDQLMA